jgi:hypothetical protein
LAKVNIPEPKKRKLGPKTVDCIFIGYAQNSPAYRFLIVKYATPEMIVDTIMESKDATFFENIFPMRQTSGSLENVDVVIPDFPYCAQVENIPLREDDEEKDVTTCPGKYRTIA